VGARAGLRFDESMVYLECSGEVTASVRYWDGVDGRPVAQGNIARQRVERSQKGQRVAALERFYFVFVLVLFILLSFIVLILYSIFYFKNGVPAGGIEASASGGGWSPVHAASEMGGVWGRSLTRFDQRRIPMQEGQASPGLILGMTGCSCPSEGMSGVGLVWSGLVLVWSWSGRRELEQRGHLLPPSRPGSVNRHFRQVKRARKKVKLRLLLLLQASRVEDEFSGSQQSRPRVALRSLARCTARRFHAEGGWPAPPLFIPPGSPLWSGLLQASGSDWLAFDAGEGPRRPRGFFLA
jgi:hypothetical protein